MTEGNIFERLTAVMADVGPVGKDKKNEQQGFKYRAIDDFIQAVHPALVANGVTMIPEVLTHNSTDRATKSGGVSTRVVITARFTFYAPDGTSVSGVTVGEAADSADKASNKAMSAALKYFLMQALMVPLADLADGDKETPDMGSTAADVFANAAPATPPPDPDSRPRVLERIKALSDANKALMKQFQTDNAIPFAPGKMTDEQLAMTLVELRAFEGAA